MKKIFKYGCGCLGVVAGLIILLLIIAVSCDSDSSSVDQKKISQNNDSGEWFDGVEPEIDSQLKWEKKSPQEVLQEDAIQHVENFLKQQGIIEGYEAEKKLFCAVASASFRAQNKALVNMSRKTAELKAFLFFLSEFAGYLKYLNENVKADSTQSTSSMKWGDFDFSCVTIATGTSFSKELVLSKNGSNLITYTVNSKGERFNMPRMMIRGMAAYDELIRNFLKHHPGAVKLEYSACSWDEKTKEGEFALGLVLDLSKIKKAQ